MRWDIIKIIKELKEEEGDNQIIGRLGKTGSGKTVRQNEKNVLPVLLDKQDVWVCYWINLDKAKYPNLHYFQPRDFEKIKNLRNCVIVFDEIRRSFDPRSWEAESEDFRSFIELHRHRHNTIIFNTQDVSLVSKTVGIQAHEWSQMEKIDVGIIVKIWRKMRGTEAVDIREDYLTLQELKKMANGWELGEDVAIDAEWEIVRYRRSELLHKELDEDKEELVHMYCSRCKSRQGEQIRKGEEERICSKIYDEKGIEIGWRLKEVRYCPKHKEIELSIRETGMFDTDYEPEPNGEVFKVVKYKMCKDCGQYHKIN